MPCGNYLGGGRDKRAKSRSVELWTSNCQPSPKTQKPYSHSPNRSWVSFLNFCEETEMLLETRFLFPPQTLKPQFLNSPESFGLFAKENQGILPVVFVGVLTGCEIYLKLLLLLNSHSGA